MNNRQVTVIGVVLIATVILFTVMSFRQEAQSSKPQQQHEEATIVQKGKVTNEEREYSKEYKKIYGNGDGKKLTEIREPGGIGIFIGPGSAPRSKSETVITANQFLERLSCQSDAVVVGMVKNKMSHLSEMKHLFTLGMTLR